ncbi:hypothetical protein FQA39_LY11126 [Lamprigera yunnana]|nr:hypothetical protein FQA39_LY11126 [Lamprigera yunnana]
MARGLHEKYTELYPYLQNQTGLNITSLFHLFRLYDVLFCESMWGLTLPEWTKSVFPHFLKQGSIENFMLFNGNPELIQLAGGFHLKKIIIDMYNSLEKSQPRMYLYSAHDMNVVSLLYALNVFFPHLPPYAACVIIELHKINNIPFVKIYYEDHTLKNDIKQLVVGNCTAECPLEKFVDLLKNNIPDTSNGDPCILNEDYLYPIIA